MKAMLSTTSLIAAAVCGMLLFGQDARAVSSTDAAYDKNKQAIVDRNNNCVRTKWMSESDPCTAPKLEPAAAPAPEPVKTQFGKEERTMYFGFNKATLGADEKAKLDALAKAINASDKIKDVRIVGYTDQLGTDSYNKKLSERRVKAVIDYLQPQVRAGLTPENKDIRGAGKAPAEEACATIKKRDAKIDCMKSERRVEVEMGREFSAK